MRVNFRRVWQWTLLVAMLMIVIGIAITPTDVDQYAASMEKCMQKGDYAAALEVGERSDKTSRRLMQLRLDALSHEHLLGERLFSYPVIGKSTDYTGNGGDFELCCCLIDKQVDQFVALLPRYYPRLDNLPRYYREALILYKHLRANPQILYSDNVLDTDYRDMQELERQYPDGSARQVAVFQQYEGTYWYYYEYQ